VSIQSLIMVDHPYFNEPGYESSMGSPEGDVESFAYNAFVRLATIKHAMVDSLKQPSGSFAPVIRKHFLLQREVLKEQGRQWLADAENYIPGTSGSVVSYTKDTYKQDLTLAVEELNRELDLLKE